MAALVWFKRDLRVHDHAPLALAAAHADGAAALYAIEPAWRASAEFDPQHLRFALQCLAELRAQLQPRGLPLHVLEGEMPALLERLHARLGFDTLLSHEETGPGWSYARDLAVAAWCRSRGVRWVELPQHGVVRRLRRREGWAARWQARMDAAEAQPPRGWRPLGPLASRPLPPLPEARAGQAGGETQALALLDSFLQARGQDYRRALSSPLTAAEGCSRLSPHLAFGSLSLRRAHQATETRIAEAAGRGERDWAYALRGFAGRLRWHCHFIQKLEDEPAIEFRDFAPVYAGLRPDAPFEPDAQARFEAWCEGRTGWPLVDACMRQLRATGWLNFRMRALLVSVASYPLWLHWRATGPFLGRQFLDFEAGIHWSQMQMQSGTTGINTLRVYSPTKQARDQDPQGAYIRRWVPELARVPLSFLAQPWLMPPAMQREAGCRLDLDYPRPLVDEQLASAAAKAALSARRRTPEALAQADAVQARHGSRRSGLPASPKPRRRTSATAPGQQSLF